MVMRDGEEASASAIFDYYRCLGLPQGKGIQEPQRQLEVKSQRPACIKSNTFQLNPDSWSITTRDAKLYFPPAKGDILRRRDGCESTLFTYVWGEFPGWLVYRFWWDKSSRLSFCLFVSLFYLQHLLVFPTLAILTLERVVGIALKAELGLWTRRVCEIGEGDVPMRNCISL